MMIKDLLLCSIVLDDKLLSVLTTWLILFFHWLFKTIKLGIIYLSVIDYKWGYAFICTCQLEKSTCGLN